MNALNTETLLPFTAAATRAALSELASNFAFAWIPGARELFAALDAEAWERCGGNPVALLAGLGDDVLERAGADPRFRGALDRVRDALRAELEAGGWWPHAHGGERELLVAYFSLEFGVDASL